MPKQIKKSDYGPRGPSFWPYIVEICVQLKASATVTHYTAHVQ